MYMIDSHTYLIRGANAAERNSFQFCCMHRVVSVGMEGRKRQRLLRR
jgi:hypothetical protein